MFFLPITILFSQIKRGDVPECFLGSNLYLKNKLIEFSNVFDIPYLPEDTLIIERYRINTGKQLIEVSKNENVYKGQIISYISKYENYKYKKNKENKLVFELTVITSDTAKLIFNAFKCLDSIPDMKRIKGWDREYSCGGSLYIIEKSDKKNYKLSRFVDPSLQYDSTYYKQDILEFIDFLYDECYIYDRYRHFTGNLRAGNYTSGLVHIYVSHPFHFDKQHLGVPASREN